MINGLEANHLQTSLQINSRYRPPSWVSKHRNCTGGVGGPELSTLEQEISGCFRYRILVQWPTLPQAMANGPGSSRSTYPAVSTKSPAQDEPTRHEAHIQSYLLCG
jgi:hypothetical protein